MDFSVILKISFLTVCILYVEEIFIMEGELRMLGGNDYIISQINDRFPNHNFERILFQSIPKQRILLVEHRIEGVIGQMYVLYSYEQKTGTLHKLRAFYSSIEVLSFGQDSVILMEHSDPSIPFPCDEKYYMYDMEQDTCTLLPDKPFGKKRESKKM